MHNVLVTVHLLFGTQLAFTSEGFFIGEQTQLDALNTLSMGEYGPGISNDGRRLFFERAGTGDIFMATRETVDHPWSTARALEGPVNSRWEERNPDVSSDGQTLLFTSSRPGGIGDWDIWRSQWDSASGIWGQPENLGATINSEAREGNPHLAVDGSIYFDSLRNRTGIWMSHPNGDEWTEPEFLFDGSSPSVSGDGLMLFYVFRNDAYVATREKLGDGWSEGINLGSKVNGAKEEEVADLEIAPNGSVLYGATWSGFSPITGDLWQVPLFQPRKPIEPGAEAYVETFDASLTTNADAGQKLPLGWTTSENGVIFDDTTTASFPLAGRFRPGLVFNAGTEGSSDRALAIGTARTREGIRAPMIQFQADVEGSDAAAFQLQFDVETWFGADGPDPRAGFDIIVDIDSGGGFVPVDEFHNVGTESLRFPPESGGMLDGNMSENRVSFDSGTQLWTFPADSALRVRWEIRESTQTRGWIFGVDDFQLTLFDDIVSAYDCDSNGVVDVWDANCSGASSLEGMLDAANLVRGDLNGDGQVQFSDFLLLSGNFGMGGTYTDGDLDSDGEVQFSDFLLFSANFGAAVAMNVPEPALILPLFAVPIFMMSRLCAPVRLKRRPVVR